MLIQEVPQSSLGTTLHHLCEPKSTAPPDESHPSRSRGPCSAVARLTAEGFNLLRGTSNSNTSCAASSRIVQRLQVAHPLTRSSGVLQPFARSRSRKRCEGPLMAPSATASTSRREPLQTPLYLRVSVHSCVSLAQPRRGPGIIRRPQFIGATRPEKSTAPESSLSRLGSTSCRVRADR